jgi:hypothetical protein
MTHGDKFDLKNSVFSPFPEKFCIKYTPIYDRTDYHISLDVFSKYEVAKVIIKYMLDNEANDVVGLMGSEKVCYHGEKSTFLRFVETDDTNAWFCKLQLPGEEIMNKYSGTNVYVDIVPFSYEDADRSSNAHETMIYSIEDELMVIVFDKNDTLPVIDAKIEVSEGEELICRTGTDKFGKAVVRKGILKEGKTYKIKVIDNQESHEATFIFEENSHGVCLV